MDMIYQTGPVNDYFDLTAEEHRFSMREQVFGQVWNTHSCQDINWLFVLSLFSRGGCVCFLFSLFIFISHPLSDGHLHLQRYSCLYILPTKCLPWLKRLVWTSNPVASLES